VEQIAAVFAEVLEVDRVGPAVDFFALGGDSLMAMKVIARISSAYQVELSAADLFLYPTPGELEAEITRRLSEEPGNLESLLNEIEQMTDEEVGSE